MVVTAGTLGGFLDTELRIEDFQDSSNNGLQVGDETQEVARVCFGVDASMEFFEKAAARNADAVVCHHGISWSDSLKRIAGLNYRRIEFLVRHGIVLYAYHLPLDAHPKYGNNAQICRVMDMKKVKPFGYYKGKQIGFMGEFSEPLSYTDFKEMIRARVGREIKSMDFGGDQIRTVAVISGAASEGIEEAAIEGVDAYLSGEPSLVAYNLAREYNINAIFAGHYATEVFGVRTLSKVVAKRFGIETGMIDLGIPF